MNTVEGQPVRCEVLNGHALPADAGNADDVCAVIKAAVSSLAPAANYSVEVRVLSPTSLAATVRLEAGQILPEQKLTISDRQLNRSAIQRFARTIGKQIAEASQK